MIDPVRLAAGAVLAIVAACSGSDVTVTGAWIRTPPPGAKTAAAYLTIDNRTGRTLRIVGIDSPQFESAMLHETVVENGTARMMHATATRIDAGARLVLEPGALHVMLHDPRSPVNPGDSVPLTLHFDDGTFVTVAATVRQR